MPPQNSELDNLITGILKLADDERQKDDAYQDLFKRSSSVAGLVRALDDKMVHHVLNATKILGESFGYRSLPREKRDEVFFFLLALPYLRVKLCNHIEATQGSACSVDKTYHHLEKQLESLLGLSEGGEEKR